MVYTEPVETQRAVVEGGGPVEDGGGRQQEAMVEGRGGRQRCV